jgi:hypothetical protein
MQELQLIVTLFLCLRLLQAPEDGGENDEEEDHHRFGLVCTIINAIF